MHEYTVAYDIYATARRAALENAATRVKKISADFGEMSMINPEQVDFLFSALSDEDELFQGAVLEYRTILVKTVCSCGYEGDERYVCPTCGKLPEIVAGREICVTNIEIEVDDE